MINSAVRSFDEDDLDCDQCTEDGDGADGDPHRSGAPPRLPHAGEETGSGNGGEQANAARQDDELPVESDREE